MFNRRLFVAALTATFAAASSGLAFGYSSAAAFQIFLSVEWSAVFASCLNVGGLFGSILSGYLLSKHGRRWTICYSCLPGIVGWFWLRLSVNAVYERYSPTFLFIAGRVMTGVSAGMIIPSAAAYLVEISPPELHGFFGTLPQIGIVFGITVAYLFGAFFAWEHVALINTLVMLFLLILCFGLPESPKWLIKSGHIQQAGVAQTWLYDALPGSDVESAKPTEDSPSPEIISDKGILSHIFPCIAVPPSLRSRLRIVMLLMVFQQLSGINAILYFAESVCMFGGLPWPSLCAVMLGGFQLLFTLIAAFFINRFSRKRMFKWSSLIMCIAHLVHAAVILFGKPYTIFTAIGKISVIVFLLGFSIGWGPLPILIAMDLFPTSHRGFAGSAGVAVNWIASFVVTIAFEPLSLLLGATTMFCFFSLFSFLSYLFTVRYIPETIVPDPR